MEVDGVGTTAILLCRDQRSQDTFTTTRIYSIVGGYIRSERDIVQDCLEGAGGALQPQDRRSKGSKRSYVVSFLPLTDVYRNVVRAQANLVVLF